MTRQIRKLTHTLRHGKKGSFEQDLSRFLRWNFLKFAGPVNIFVSVFPSMETAFVTLFFSAFTRSAGQISQLDTILRDFHRSKLKKIKGKAKLSLASAFFCRVLAEQKNHFDNI